MATLFTGGAVVTMDPRLGDLARGDVLVTGETIAAVGPDLREHPAAAGATVVDTTGRIVAPGFVDTHRHAWQAQMRRTIPDVLDLGAYVTSTLAEVAPAYTPHDMYVGTRLAALTALDAGITTMLDFSHNSRSAAHSDAAVRALAGTGIRGVHASMGPHFGTWDRQWPADLTRLRAELPDRVSLRLAALATAEIAGPELAYGPELAAVARDLDVEVSVDAVFGVPSSEAVLAWERQGLLGPRLTLIHATGLTPDAWRAIGESGTRISLAPTSDTQLGLETGIPAIDEALAVGVRPGLSIDVEVALASDMFTQMRVLLAVQRMRAVGGSAPRITTRDVLGFATLYGAETAGLGAVTGSLTPGKQADLLVVEAEAVNTMPLNDAVGTLVLGADPRNVSTVLVGGRTVKSEGRLVGVDLGELRREVTASRDAIVSAVAS
ncbi:amidohydrolase family protein [Pseudosporangium ferrugineum]|uniref:Cytosine/adenosine deaminase-related metal-dependent hydrolase n=1 Tax=Pseudosporangium ferrugineum TaxID=439699 RepID=A0A2T0SEN4_9ACTN|nr:amidohydrolase family protein [Pseudosporangium ferrugineum]PRY31870.1 cytosine/adenosine deaminase-related metal-dependent hydrolase [Pseudosporangium ferrugineum]